MEIQDCLSRINIIERLMLAALGPTGAREEALTATVLSTNPAIPHLLFQFSCFTKLLLVVPPDKDPEEWYPGYEKIPDARIAFCTLPEAVQEPTHLFVLWSDHEEEEAFQTDLLGETVPEDNRGVVGQALFHLRKLTKHTVALTRTPTFARSYPPVEGAERIVRRMASYASTPEELLQRMQKEPTQEMLQDYSVFTALLLPYAMSAPTPFLPACIQPVFGTPTIVDGIMAVGACGSSFSVKQFNRYLQEVVQAQAPTRWILGRYEDLQCAGDAFGLYGSVRPRPVRRGL